MTVLAPGEWRPGPSPYRPLIGGYPSVATSRGATVDVLSPDLSERITWEGRPDQSQSVIRNASAITGAMSELSRTVLKNSAFGPSA